MERRSSASISYWQPGFPGLLLGVLRRGLLFALVWWVLVGGDAESWWIGVPAVLLAAAISVALLSPIPVTAYALFGFLPFFLFRSLLGAADVAWRAFHPRMPIAPHLIEYPLRLPSGLPRVFMANTVSLLPGTLSAVLGSNSLLVHVLNGRKDALLELETVEQRVAALFGASLPVRQVE